MAILRILALAPLLSAVVAGCMRDPVGLDLDPEVAVHAVLLAGSTTANVFITRVHPSPDGLDAWIDPVSGADVVLHTPDDHVPLTEAASADACYRPFDDDPAWAATRGCYTATVPGAVRAGNRYALSIRLPDGATISGETTVPDQPELLAPADGEQVRIGGGDGIVTVRWRPTPPLGRAEIAVESLVPDCWAGLGEPLAYAQAVILDPARGEAPDIRLRGGCSALRSAFPARFVFMSFDTAYARYADVVLGQAWAAHPRASAGLSGALGVFGSAAAAEHRIEILLAPW